MIPDWKSIPSLSALRAFDATARHQSFAAAARTLNVTQAAVAQHVRGLEAELGLSLVVRSGRGVALTEVGIRLAAALEEGFGTIAAGLESIRGEDRTRPVRISTSASLVDGVLMHHLAGFWQRHPDIELSFSPSNRPVDLAREGFDLAVRIGKGNWPGLDSELLAETRTLACGAPELVGEGTPDFAALPWIWNRNLPWEEESLVKLGLDPRKLRRVEVGNLLYEVAAARRGFGMIVTTELIVREDILAGRMRAFPIPDGLRFQYHAVTLPGPKRAALEECLNWLRGLAKSWREPLPI